LSTKKDHIIVSLLSINIGVLLIPILTNIQLKYAPTTVPQGLLLILIFLIVDNIALWLASWLAKYFTFMWQFAKYVVTGVFNTILDTSIFNILTFTTQVFAGSLIILFKTISFSIAVTIAYFLNRSWAFQTQKASDTKEFLSYVVATAGGLLINLGIVGFLVNIMGAPPHISQPLWINIANLIAVAFSMIWNFIAYKFFIFKSSTEDKS